MRNLHVILLPDASEKIENDSKDLDTDHKRGSVSTFQEPLDDNPANQVYEPLDLHDKDVAGPSGIQGKDRFAF